MKKSYYFPPCGFGFWYQLGVFDQIKNDDNILYGSSAGSLICLISLLKDEDYDLLNLINLAKQVKDNNSFNLYKYTNQFVSEIIKIISSYDDDYINKKLDNINIEITLIKFYIIPYFQSVYVKPKDLNHLKNLIIASCYVPFISYHENLFYYKYENMYIIDGFFGKFSNVDPKIKKINSYHQATIIPGNEKDVISKYSKGVNYDFNQSNKRFSIYSLFLIIINIFVDFIKFLVNDFVSLL